MLETGQPVTVLDVRNADDRTEWSIPGSLHVDAYEALKSGDPDALAGLDLPAGMPVVTVCGAGKTSMIAAEQLRARGIDAHSLAGGMQAWSLAWNVGDVAYPEWRASSVGVYRLWRDGGYAIGALIAGAIADLLGLRWAIAAVGLLTVVSGAIVLLVMSETLVKQQQESTLAFTPATSEPT
jgi:rhodanese-related sulfurtransferase